jgi:Protein of unknown function (DUF3311)
MAREKRKREGARRWHRLLFVIPYAAVLWVPFYNRIEPELGGIPFFYWYQLLWILLGAAIVGIVYAIDHKVSRAQTEEGDTTGVPGDIL